MGMLNVSIGSGGGTGSEELTATRADVLKGRLAVTSDSGDEAAAGTLELTGNATAAFVYTGKTFYSTDPKTKLTGAMTISSVVSFSIAAYSTSQVICTWKNPAKGPYSGVLIRYKTGSSPTSVTDGTQGYKGVGSNSALNGTSSVTVGGLAAGTTYYFRIWVYCTTSAGTLYSSPVSETGKPTASGRKVLTTSGTWTVPANVRMISVHCTGGGGGGGGAYIDDGEVYGGGGGGGGYTAYIKNISVTPGQVFTITVGAGGNGSSYGHGSNGSVSSFTNSSGTVLVSANGGYGGRRSYNPMGANGGSGGGKGSWSTGNGGGSNGGNGGGSSSGTGNYLGLGQGTTTRELGNASYTLYAGGGGGGGKNSGAGGAGGGGAGGSNSSPHGTAGSAGTGGGGGGTGSDSGMMSGAGGCGNVVIRW